MKKTLIIFGVVFILVACMQFTISAEQSGKEISVIIPDYEILLDNASVYYYDSFYPFLNYKGVTYFPATFEYCKSMDLACGFIENEAFLIAHNPSAQSVPVYETTVNTKENTAVIPAYNIIINGKRIDNASLEYPFFNFRGVTYIPITWDFAVNEFGWTLDFTDNKFTITTEPKLYNSLGQLVEVGREELIFSEYGYFEMPQPDGTVQNIPGNIYYSVSFKTGETTRRDDYVLNNTNTGKFSNDALKVLVKDGYVYFGQQQLPGVFIEEAAPGFVKPDDAYTVDYQVNMYKLYEYSPLSVCKLNVYIANRRYDGSAYGTNVDYTYLLHDDKMIFLGANTDVSNHYVIGNYIYFNTNRYWKTIHSHALQNKQLYRLSKDGTLEQIKYPDYCNMEIIGMAQDKLYLKCTWSPEDYVEGSEVVVSLVSDGYFTYDGTHLEKIADYVYSTFDAVSPNGEILAINRRLGKVIKVK